MKSKTSEWFTCKVRYDKTMEDGTVKKVTEAYVVEALSFTEAEASIIEEMSPYIRGEFEVVDISRAAFKEVMFMGDGEKAVGNQVEALSKAIQKKDAAVAQEVYDRPLEEQMKHTDTRWYKSKVQFITLDERSGKEKRSNVQYLVEGCSLESARSNVDTMMGSTMIDYVIASVVETAVMDVIEHEVKGEPEA